MYACTNYAFNINQHEKNPNLSWKSAKIFDINKGEKELSLMIGTQITSD